MLARQDLEDGGAGPGRNDVIGIELLVLARELPGQPGDGLERMANALLSLGPVVESCIPL